jgi:hypothetical protein
MIDLCKGFLSAIGGAFVFGLFIAVAYFARHRYPRTRELQDLDFDNAHPDGWVDHFKNGDRQ